MNLFEKHKEAIDNLCDCENLLLEIQGQHKDQVKTQKQLIFIAKQTVKAYETLIEKAKALEKSN